MYQCWYLEYIALHQPFKASTIGNTGLQRYIAQKRIQEMINQEQKSPTEPF